MAKLNPAWQRIAPAMDPDCCLQIKNKRLAKNIKITHNNAGSNKNLQWPAS